MADPIKWDPTKSFDTPPPLDPSRPIHVGPPELERMEAITLNIRQAAEQNMETVVEMLRALDERLKKLEARVDTPQEDGSAKSWQAFVFRFFGVTPQKFSRKNLQVNCIVAFGLSEIFGHSSTAIAEIMGVHHATILNREDKVLSNPEWMARYENLRKKFEEACE